MGAETRCGSMFLSWLRERRSRTFAVSAPSGANFIDLSHETCLPGLIDTHPHILLQGDITAADYDPQLLKQSPPYRMILATVNARRALDYGFTSIRDLETESAGICGCRREQGDQQPRASGAGGGRGSGVVEDDSDSRRHVQTGDEGWREDCIQYQCGRIGLRGQSGEGGFVDGEVGMTPAQALMSATATAAELLGEQSSLGIQESGEDRGYCGCAGRSTEPYFWDGEGGFCDESCGGGEETLRAFNPAGAEDAESENGDPYDVAPGPKYIGRSLRSG